MPRTAPANDLMWLRLFQRFAQPAGTLQGQLRDMLVQAIVEGFLIPGAPLPGTRVLASTLGLSRTTVTLAIQALADRGILLSRPRSGYVVAPALAMLDVAVRHDQSAAASASADWQARLQMRPTSQRNIVKPPDWQRQPYPFIYGQFDGTLFPFRDWRACALESLQPQAVRRWAPDHLDRDDEALVDQIHRRLLPARGIWAERGEILVTCGVQQANFLLATLLIGPGTRVGMEDPGYPDARNNFKLRTPYVRALPVDADGLVVGPALTGCQYVYVTPSHQCPTTVTMPLARRQALLAQAQRDDFVVIEDDHESELNFDGRPTAALKSLDSSERVLYLGSLSKTLAHGLRLGYLVAPAELVRELRALRRLMMRHVPTNNQQAAASFIAHGHHEAYLRQLNQAYRARATAVHAALARHAPTLQAVTALGGSAVWVSGPAGLDGEDLAARLYRQGVVVERGDIFYQAGERQRQQMRIGYSSIPLDRIETGIRLLGQELATRPG